MSDIQAISGTRRAIKEMADGTIRVQVDIDPRFRGAFWSLFPNIDMPVALAPLVAAFEQQEGDEQPVECNPEPKIDQPKGGALARLAAMWCQEEAFWDFLLESDLTGDRTVTRAETAAEWVRLICGIESRADLDNVPAAKAIFDEHIRGPYAKYRAAKGLK